MATDALLGATLEDACHQFRGLAFHLRSTIWAQFILKLCILEPWTTFALNLICRRRMATSDRHLKMLQTFYCFRFGAINQCSKAAQLITEN